jgi:hypothetical protein
LQINETNKGNKTGWKKEEGNNTHPAWLCPKCYLKLPNDEDDEKEAADAKAEGYC